MSDLNLMLNAHVGDLLGLLMCCDCIVSIFALVIGGLLDSPRV